MKYSRGHLTIKSDKESPIFEANDPMGELINALVGATPAIIIEAMSAAFDADQLETIVTRLNELILYLRMHQPPAGSA